MVAFFGAAVDELDRCDLPRTVERELIAHAVGHHAMHSENHLTLQVNTYSVGNCHEKQANVLAALPLIPEDELNPKLESVRSIPDLGHDFGVAGESVAFRLKIRQVAGYDAKHESAAQGQKSVDNRWRGYYYESMLFSIIKE
ncbi:MAG: ImmA/IrrE family metallo-endopeptidase [Actinobacteria bacterium]|nr:ImmA/IrrE family metallo-endopeptidase [Actinomycetota bacterium]